MKTLKHSVLAFVILSAACVGHAKGARPVFNRAQVADAVIYVLDQAGATPFGSGSCLKDVLYSVRSFTRDINEVLPCAKVSPAEIGNLIGHPLSQTHNLPVPCANVVDMMEFLEGKCAH